MKASRLIFTLLLASSVAVVQLAAQQTNADQKPIEERILGKQQPFFKKQLIRDSLARRLISAWPTNLDWGCRRIWGKQESFIKKRLTKITNMRRKG
jgi:hypothetical protein